jgi:alkylation response protein AidB-like acyl-CoA dehydrogenase
MIDCKWWKYVYVFIFLCVCADRAAQLGSEAQKDKYLPPLSKLHKVCAYVSDKKNHAIALWSTACKKSYLDWTNLVHFQAMTEPDNGSDASALTTIARKVLIWPVSWNHKTSSSWRERKKRVNFTPSTVYCPLEHFEKKSRL